VSSLPLTARTKYKELPEEETDQIAKAASIEQALRQLAPLQIAEGLLITGITTDPALCRPGFVYVADESETVDSTRLGVRLDGRAYIGPAIENGAAVVITTPDVQPLTGAQFILRENPLALLGPLASRFYSKDVPPPQCIALVTGTNGKTSTVNFCRMLWTRRGKNACSIGNLGGVLSDGSLVWARDPVLSVPETVTLHKIFHDLARKGVQHVAMEATSHALFDHRLDGTKATIGAFTNLTRDHLDFHGTMEEYFRVKMTLFQNVLPEGSFAVLNADAPWYEEARAICLQRRHQVLSFGEKGDKIKLLAAETTKNGQKLKLLIDGKTYQSNIQLFGRFQLENVLCSLAIALASGLSTEECIEALPFLEPVEGRLNQVATTPEGGRVIVDYAHTPDGLQAALKACRSFTRGKLWVVFGANGERDPGKRIEMGREATALADEVIITDGQIRREDPAKIRAAVKAGAPEAREITPRVKAIQFACENLGNGDTVLIAGFGHEKFQVIGETVIPYSDAETAVKIVGALAQSCSK